MRALLTILSLCGAVSASGVLFPVAAGDFDDRDSTEPLDPMDLVIQKARASDAETVPPPTEEDARLTPEELNRPTVPVEAPPEPKLKIVPDVVRVITGEASWYGPGFYGNRTASGEVYQPGTMTAAHRSLPFGTKVRVTNLWNGRSAVIRINDRGPFVDHRVIDLGHGAASQLGVTSSGIAQVKLEVLR